jgi:hypothetical protein
MFVGPTLFAHYEVQDGAVQIGLAHWLVLKRDGVPMLGAHFYSEAEANMFFDAMAADLDRERKATIRAIRRKRRQISN